MGKYRGIFKINTSAGAEFQISEVKIYHIFVNIVAFSKRWSLPITDGLEYYIQPDGLHRNWEKHFIQGWKLIQILLDSNCLHKQLSREYEINDQTWSNVKSTITSILPNRKDGFKLCNLIQEVLTDHGRPLFRDIISVMVKDRGSQFSDKSVYSILTTHKLIFYRHDVGVYGLLERTSSEHS